MKCLGAQWLSLLVVCTAGSGVSAPTDQGAAKIDFNRQIRPILSDNCFACHGPDEAKRKSGLRLDLREAAIQRADSGRAAIVPGIPDDSELLKRLVHSDPDDRMPPASTGKKLTAPQIELLKEWIREGAEYKPHWAFVPPRRQPLPTVKSTSWPRNAIDYFILSRLEKEGLKPATPADPYTLARRVYLDLIGLPPMPEEIEDFVADPSDDAYEQMVDRLLASPHYGERWARLWLDLARYADTNGYEKDRARSIWPYRDWVINALNADLPFDQFTVEQLAGDMLPNPTLQQRIATGFHRNTMLNEEGGIDPLEFRFHAMTDRVGTTGKTWLGLTIACAQCHTHKYDPITQKEYYQFMAFMNNADEPELTVPSPKIIEERKSIQARIDHLTKHLSDQFPVDTLQWETPKPLEVSSAEGATPTVKDDGSVLVTGATPERDRYLVMLEVPGDAINAIRVEALTDPTLPAEGPGRTPHGNFVLSEISVVAAPADALTLTQEVKFARAEADFAQNGFPVGHVIDGKRETGWAIHGEGKWNVNRTATFHLETPLAISGRARLAVTLHQEHGMRHTLGRFKISVARPVPDDRPIHVRREERVRETFRRWLEKETKRASAWTILTPAAVHAAIPVLSILPDQSILASGDQSKSDTYEVEFRGAFRGITALRLEALPDERLPKGGPGRVYYEGSPGDFLLSDFSVRAGEQAVPLSGASQSFASGNYNAAAAIDDNKQTGWSINGGQGRAHNAVFNFEKPWNGSNLTVRLLCERYYAAGLGRFRLSYTTNTEPVTARNLPHEIGVVLLTAAAERTPEQREQLFAHFLHVTPELAGARADIDKLRRSLPEQTTTLALTERPAHLLRKTFLHRRGEFLQPADEVSPGLPAVLPGLPEGAPRDRLHFARWLVDPANPLVGRVTVNRHWAAFFGKGIVPTSEDFGFQGASPSHPELLDWLALRFVEDGYSTKRLHKLIVMSATYQQSSQATPASRAVDPGNQLLARGPYARLEAELIRDAALKISGLLSPKLGGPSVYPPQPASVTTEGAYGRLDWKVSSGPDRYRRGLYTFMKRTAPYAMFQTFDAPSGEACVVQREVSNTPLQALTLLNDPVFVEVTQALGSMMADRSGSLDERLDYLFQRCISRPPADDERRALKVFFQKELARCEQGELDAAAIAGGDTPNMKQRAAWTILARTLLNLDEAITKG